MDTTSPTMTHLFQQLGLPEAPADIARFIERHRPLPDHISLKDAPFWTPAQATFVRDKLQADDQWAVVVDALNASLRSSQANA